MVSTASLVSIMILLNTGEEKITVKRKILHPATVLLCLMLFLSVLPAWAENTSPAGRLLLIKKAGYDPESGVLTITWKNTGRETVTGAEIRINPVDTAGGTLVIGEGYIEEILLEERILHTSAVSEPGKDVTVSFLAGKNYPSAAGFEISIDRIEKTAYTDDAAVSERVVLELPDDRLAWYSTLTGNYTEEPKNTAPYTVPADEVFEQADEIHLGITTIPVTEELAEAYGFGHGGIMIAAVEENSPADLIGLEPGDLIWCVNDIQYTSDPYMMTRGTDGLADGYPVHLRLERENELWELTLTPGETNNQESGM